MNYLLNQYYAYSTATNVSCATRANTIAVNCFNYFRLNIWMSTYSTLVIATPNDLKEARKSNMNITLI